MELAEHCSQQTPPPRFALSVTTKDLHFQNNHKIHPCSLVLLSKSQTKAFCSLPSPTEGGSSTASLQPQLGTFSWAWRKSLSPDGNDQNLCLSSPKKKHNQKTSNSAAFSAKSLKCQTSYSECFMKNFARRCFNALCYKYSEAILCK